MHHVLFGGIAFGIMAGLYYWFPKMSGRMMSEGLGKLSFWLMVIGFNVTFLPQYSAGLSGMPRRVAEYHCERPDRVQRDLDDRRRSSSPSGVLVTVYNVFVSIRKGRPAGPDPWRGEHARVVHALAAAAAQLRRDPDGAQPRADEGHPPRGAGARGRARRGQRTATAAAPHVTEPPGKQPEPL